MSDQRSRMAARKQLLLARAAIERIELAGQLGRVKASMSPRALAGSLLPSDLTAGGAAATALKTWRLLRRYPFVSSAASMLFAKLPFGGVFRVAKLGGAGYAAWQAYKIWKEVQPDAAERERRAARKQARDQVRALRDIARRG